MGAASSQGHGTIGGDVANADGGVLSPGGSIGTLTLGGDYTQGRTSRLRIEVSPTAASQLRVLGNASLDGNLLLVYQPGVYSDASYGILNAAGITGTFDTVTGQTPAGFTQSVSYSPTDVTWISRRQRPDHRHPDQRHDLHGAQHRRPARGAAGQWRAAHPYGRAASRHRQPDGADRPRLYRADTSRLRRHRRPARRSLPAIPQAVGQMGGWFKAIGSFASLDGSISTPGFDTQAGGFLAGFDKAVSANFTVGVAAGYLHTNLSEAGGASGSIDTPRLAVYGSYTLGDFAIDATAGYAYDFINASRPFANLGQTGSSSYNGQEANAALQVSTPGQLRRHHLHAAPRGWPTSMSPRPASARAARRDSISASTATVPIHSDPSSASPRPSPTPPTAAW